jgi:DNA-binding XRE family transcriptional regulator
MKELFKAIDEKIRKLIITETEKRSIPTHKTLRKVERTLAKIEKRLAFLEQEFLTNPPNQPNNQTPRKFRIKGPDIIAIRQRFNLSQAAFARLIEIDRATLNRWEHSKVRPNQSSMAKIAEFRTMGKKEFARRMAQAEEAIWK